MITTNCNNKYSISQHFTLFTLACCMLLTTGVSSLKFAIDIDGSSQMCFSHFISKFFCDIYQAQSTPFHFVVEGENTEFTLEMRFKDGTVLVRKDDETSKEKKIDSYAAVTEHYNFCINNPSSQQSFIISFYQGLQLSDISLLPKQQDHQLIDKLVDQLNTLYQSVRSQQLYMKTVNEYNMQLQKLVSFKYVGFGFLSITVVLIISFLHYLEIKRVLRTRKVI